MVDTPQSNTKQNIELWSTASVNIVEPAEEEEEANFNRLIRAFKFYGQPCIAELLGTTLFIFVGCMSVIENSPQTGRLQPALAHGLALGIVIALFGEISGGHFNPAVSVSVCLVGGLNVLLLAPYIVVQLCGGLIGASLAKAISQTHSYHNASGGAFNILQTDSQITNAILAEMMLTLFLTMSVCMSAVNGKTRTILAPFCIGLTVTAGVLGGSVSSGGCMNPARAFGPGAVVNHWTYQWIYWVGPMIGALLTATLVRLFLGDEKIRVLLK